MDITETQSSTTAGYAGRNGKTAETAAPGDFAATIAGMLRDLGRGAQTQLSASAVENDASLEFDKSLMDSEKENVPVEARPAEDDPKRADEDRDSDAPAAAERDRDDDDKDVGLDKVDEPQETETVQARPDGGRKSAPSTAKTDSGEEQLLPTTEPGVAETAPVEETQAAATDVASNSAVDTTTEAVGQVIAGAGAAAQAAPTKRPGETRAAATQTGAEATTPIDRQARAQVAPTGQTGNQSATLSNNHQGNPATANAATATATTNQPAAQTFVAETATDSSKAQSATTAQAAGIAKAVGANDGTPIKIDVTTRGGTVTSQPNSALSAASAAAQGAVDRPGALAASASHAAPADTGAPMTPAQMAPQQTTQTPAQATPSSATESLSGIKAAGTATSSSLSSTGTASATGSGGEPTASAQTTQTTPQTATQHTQATHAQRPTAQNQAVLDHVSVQIAKAAKAGVDKIEIQLRPASMGRIDVSLEVTHDGRVSAVVTADKQDTLDMLRQDARTLEKALQDAGLQTDSGDLTFNLRGQEQQGTERQTASGPAGGAEVAGAEAEEESAPDIPVDYFDGIRPDGRVDIRA